MNFHIYRMLSSGTAVHLGSTKYREDADAIYARWHSAYIVTDEGAMIARKGW